MRYPEAPLTCMGEAWGGPFLHYVPEQHEDLVRESVGIQSGVGEIFPVVDILVNRFAELLKGCV